MQLHERRFNRFQFVRVARRAAHGARCAALCVGLLSMVNVSSASPERARSDPDGTVHLPPREIPLSNYLSPEARELMIRRFTVPLESPFPGDIVKARAHIEEFLQPLLNRAKDRYPGQIVRTKIANVPVFDITPRAGVARQNANRVLINLHGGAFSVCEITCALTESLPIAGIGGIRVVSVSYRQGPEHKFPAASEDVAAVYAELLKRYRPENIGIFGCSAGGMLTAESLAWFQKEKLPRPGAAGILCATAIDFGGDAPFVQWPLDDGRLTPPPTQGDRIGRRVELPPFEYFSGANARDPLVQPGHFPEV